MGNHQGGAHFILLAQAATMLACGRTTLYEYVKEGRLHLIHHGRHSVLALQEVDRLAADLAAEAGVELELAYPAFAREQEAAIPEWGESSRAWRHGITVERLREMMASGVCDICGAEAELELDHDHACCHSQPECGKCLRGAVCHRCNIGLARFNDDPALLRGAAEYLGPFHEGFLCLQKAAVYLERNQSRQHIAA